MDEERKQKLEKLRNENKIRLAKEQLICDLNSRYHINITNRMFVDYQLSADVYKKVYERIRSGDVKTERFPYEYHNAHKKI